MAGRFQYETWDHGRLQVNRQFASALQANALTTFEALFHLPRGEVVREVGGRRTTRIILRHDDQDLAFFVKRHARPKFSDRLRPLIHLSWPVLGARNEWNAILLFHAAGIPTMTPAVLGESQGRSLIMTLDLRSERSLLDWFDAATHAEPGEGRTAAPIPPARRELIARVAQIARRMHESGLHHQDFYLNHLLCCGDSVEPVIHVIDLGRVRQRSKVSRRWIAKDLAQLDYSARGLSCREKLTFLRLYLGRPFRSQDRWLVRWITLKSGHIASHTAKYGL